MSFPGLVVTAYSAAQITSLECASYYSPITLVISVSFSKIDKYSTLALTLSDCCNSFIFLKSDVCFNRTLGGSMQAQHHLFTKISYTIFFPKLVHISSLKMMLGSTLCIERPHFLNSSNF